jgi:hypothetical protein
MSQALITLAQMGLANQQRFIQDNQAMDKHLRERRPLAEIIPQLRGDDDDHRNSESNGPKS